MSCHYFKIKQLRLMWEPALLLIRPSDTCGLGWGRAETLGLTASLPGPQSHLPHSEVLSTRGESQVPDKLPAMFMAPCIFRGKTKGVI